MLTAVTDIQTVNKLQKEFESKLKQTDVITKKLSVGYKSGNRSVNVSYIENLGIWFSLNKIQSDSHFWNPFGVGEPTVKGSNSIILEINYSNKSKPNFRTAAVWAVDNDQNYYLLHSGEIGGGRTGINKETFINKYYGSSPIDVDLLGRIKKYYLISALKDKKFSNNVADFIKQVDSIKMSVNLESYKEPINSKKNQDDYFQEFFGLKSYAINKTITYNSNHGKIVKALKETLTSEGFTVKKYGQIDLAIHTKNKMSHLFEFKTSVTSSNVYSAIGQLYLYSEYNNAKPFMFFVSPHKETKSNLIHYLKKINIQVITYSLHKDGVFFNNLELIK